MIIFCLNIMIVHLFIVADGVLTLHMRQHMVLGNWNGNKTNAFSCAHHYVFSKQSMFIILRKSFSRCAEIAVNDITANQGYPLESCLKPDYKLGLKVEYFQVSLISLSLGYLDYSNLHNRAIELSWAEHWRVLTGNLRSLSSHISFQLTTYIGSFIHLIS